MFIDKPDERPAALRNWQATVESTLPKVRLVVLVIGRTEGILWELRRILDLGLYRRTLFVFPPVPAEEVEPRWEKFQQLTAGTPALEALRGTSPIGAILAFVTKSGETALIRSRYTDQLSYEAAVKIAIASADP